MTNMSIQPLWLTYFIEILLVLEFQLTKMYFGTFSYKAHFRPQIFSNERESDKRVMTLQVRMNMYWSPLSWELFHMEAMIGL